MIHLPTLTVTEARRPTDWADAGDLLDDYFAWVVSVAGVGRIDDLQPEAAAERLDPSTVYDRPGAALMLARLDDDRPRPVGMLGVIPAGAGVGELKRFFVHPEGRGRGVGRALLAAVIDRARALGHVALRLETHPELMPAAVGLYWELGFRTVDSTRLGPVCGVEVMALELAPPPAPPSANVER